MEGAYLNRYVTDEQRSRRPIFIATLRAVASWLFFCVARSTRMIQIWALRSRLEKQSTDPAAAGGTGHQLSAQNSNLNTDRKSYVKCGKNGVMAEHY